MAEIGVFKAFLPRSLGGSSATLSDQGPVIDGIACADGSAGWLAYVCSEALRQTRLLSQPVGKNHRMRSLPATSRVAKRTARRLFS